MTVLMVDYASYQGNLSLADVKRAGVAAVNFKVSHGLGTKSVHPRLVALVKEARTLGLHRSSFHWLDNSASGKAQAEFAYGRMRDAGLAWGAPHFVDCEDNASLPILTDYIAAMRGFLGHEVGIYSGDWWWTMRGWAGADLTPYLMSAPNIGYLPGYPGDDSETWIAGWGGWPAISVLQYELGVLRYPGGTTGTILVSKAAVRDIEVWAALAGGQMTSPVCTTDDLEQFAGPILPDPWTDVRGWDSPDLILGRPIELLPDNARTNPSERAVARAAWILVASLVHMRNEFNQVFPDRDHDSDGSIGDQAHQAGTSGHNPDEEGHSETTDADSINEVRAIDLDSDLHLPGVTMEDVVQYLVQKCRAGVITFIRYIIFNKRIWKASGGWVTQAYTGASDHTEHAHVSAQPDTASENDTKPLGLATLVDKGDDDMTPAEMTAWAKSKDGRFALAQAILTYDPGLDTDGKVIAGGVANPDAVAAKTNPTLGPAYALNRAVVAWMTAADNRLLLNNLTTAVAGLSTAVGAVAKNVTADDGDLAAIQKAISDTQAALQAAQKQTAQDVVAELTAAGRSDDEVADALRAALGDRASAVGRLLAGS